MFTLVTSYLTTSNLPWFMDLTFQVPMQYNAYHIRLYFHHQSHPQLCVIFTLAPSLHSFWNIFLPSSPVAYWAPTHLRSPSFSSYLFAFSYCLRGSQGKNTEVACQSLLQWTTICQNPPPWPIHLGWPYTA